MLPIMPLTLSHLLLFLLFFLQIRVCSPLGLSSFDERGPHSDFTVYHCIYGRKDYLYKLFPNVKIIEWQHKRDERLIRGTVDVLVYGFNDCPDASLMSKLKKVLVLNNFPAEKEWPSHERKHHHQNRIEVSMEKGYVYIGALGQKIGHQFAINKNEFAEKHPKVLAVPYFAKENGSVLVNINRKDMNVTRSHFLVYAHQDCQPHRERAYDSLVDLAVSMNKEKPDALGACHGKHPETFKKSFPGAMDRGAHKNTDAHSNIVYFGDYRFVLCMENTFAEGYITEKILNAYAAGTIPIYYGGGRQIFEVFNPRSFIYFDIHRPQAALNLIKRLELDNRAYMSMLAQPIFRHGRQTIEDYFSLDGSNGGKLRKKVWQLLNVRYNESVGVNSTNIDSINSGDINITSANQYHHQQHLQSVTNVTETFTNARNMKTYNEYNDKQVHEVECCVTSDGSWICLSTRTVVAPVFIFKISSWQRNKNNAISAVAYPIAGGVKKDPLVPATYIRDNSLVKSTFYDPKVYYFNLVQKSTSNLDGSSKTLTVNKVNYDVVSGIADHSSIARFISTKSDTVRTIVEVEGWERVCSTSTDKRNVPYLLESNLATGTFRIRVDVELMKLVNDEYPKYYSENEMKRNKVYNISSQQIHEAKVKSMAVSDDGCVIFMCMQKAFFVRIQTCTDKLHDARREEFDRTHTCHAVKIHTSKQLAISISHLGQGNVFLTHMHLPFSSRRLRSNIHDLGKASIRGCHGISHLQTYTDTNRGIHDGVSFIAAAVYENRFYHIVIKLDDVKANQRVHSNIIFPTMIDLVVAREANDARTNTDA